MFDANENKKDIAFLTEWKQGSQAAAEQLLKRYMPLIMNLAQQCYRPSDFEDRRQDLILCFLETAKAYDSDKNESFAGYIVPMLKWKSRDLFGKGQHLAEHEELTLEDQTETGAYEAYPVETLDTLNEAARAAHLTAKQTTVFLLWMLGRDTAEISELTGSPLRSLNRIKERIKVKLQAHQAEISPLKKS